MISCRRQAHASLGPRCWLKRSTCPHILRKNRDIQKLSEGNQERGRGLLARERHIPVCNLGTRGFVPLTTPTAGTRVLEWLRVALWPQSST